MDDTPDWPRKVTPCRPSARNLAEALESLLAARQRLDNAIFRAPEYTGQYDQKDFYADEQEDWNRAAEAYEVAVAQSVADRAEAAGRG